MHDDDQDNQQLRRAAGAAASTVRTAILLKAGPVAAVIGLICFVILAAGVTAGNDDQGLQCVQPGDPGDAPPPTTGTVLPQQIAKAKTIANVVSNLGLPGRATLVALTAAAGESDLINIGHGDAAGPDSHGLFQQRSG
jgi:hypothetical protein